MRSRLKRGWDSILRVKYQFQGWSARQQEKIKYINKKIYTGEQGNQSVGQLIKDGTPACIAKIGTTELKCLTIHQTKGGPQKWDIMKMRNGRYFGGIFPDTPEIFEQFSQHYIEALSEVSLLAIWYNKGEKQIIDRYAPQCKVVGDLTFLEPFYYADPWSQYLKGKKVLVIHPFEHSIKHQYAQREKIWANEKTLPEFELVHFKIPQNAGVQKPLFPDWVQTLDYLKSEISGIDFDVAIIGAGGWSVPLAAFIKKMGKIGVHMGGGSQVLFGIRGGRWDIDPMVFPFYNEHWINVLDEDKPNMAQVQKIPKIDQYW